MRYLKETWSNMGYNNGIQVFCNVQNNKAGHDHNMLPNEIHEISKAEVEEN